MKNGAIIDVVDNDGQTPLNLAVKSGRNRVVNYLLKKVPKQQTITNLIEIEEPKNIGMYFYLITVMNFLIEFLRVFSIL